MSELGGKTDKAKKKNWVGIKMPTQKKIGWENAKR
jgi:hypothetical protein